MNKTLRWAGLLTAFWLPSAVQAQRGPIASWKPLPGDVTPQINPGQCGGTEGHFGPLDYRTINADDKRVVEKYHFEMEVQTFLSGRLVGRNRAGTSGVMGGFDYVLKAIPNHPAALLVVEQLGRKLKSENPQNNEFPLECYYVRGFMIAPDDPVVRALYGVYLANRGRVPEAVHNLDAGDDGLRTVGSMQHQIGMANLTLRRYEKAQLNALRIRRSGFALDAVERRLRSAGKWTDSLVLPIDDLGPVAESADSSASAAATQAAASSPSAR